MNIKKETIKHYNRMIKWAKKQPQEGLVNVKFMFSEIGEDWFSEYCEYCKLKNRGYRCKLIPKKDEACFGGSNCCDGLWLNMYETRIWKQWIEGAKLVKDYIKKNG